MHRPLPPQSDQALVAVDWQPVRRHRYHHPLCQEWNDRQPLCPALLPQNPQPARAACLDLHQNQIPGADPPCDFPHDTGDNRTAPVFSDGCAASQPLSA